jgi:SNF2 family DNA or RNA helicase
MSSKVEAVIQHASAIKARGEKVLIFSQWVRMVRILQHQLQNHDIGVGVITGSTTSKQRTKIIRQFE